MVQVLYKGRKLLVHIGKNGGKYVIVEGTKRYLTNKTKPVKKKTTKTKPVKKKTTKTKPVKKKTTKTKPVKKKTTKTKMKKGGGGGPFKTIGEDSAKIVQEQIAASTGIFKNLIESLIEQLKPVNELLTRILGDKHKTSNSLTDTSNSLTDIPGESDANHTARTGESDANHLVVKLTGSE